MPWKRNFLVVANVTATSEQLIDALKVRAEQETCGFTLVIPATPFAGGREAANEKLGEALEQLREAGLEAEGSVGNADPILAVTDVWDPKKYDEIIISTLPDAPLEMAPRRVAPADLKAHRRPRHPRRLPSAQAGSCGRAAARARPTGAWARSRCSAWGARK